VKWRKTYARLFTSSLPNELNIYFRISCICTFKNKNDLIQFLRRIVSPATSGLTERHASFSVQKQIRTHFSAGSTHLPIISFVFIFYLPHFYAVAFPPETWCCQLLAVVRRAPRSQPGSHVRSWLYLLQQPRVRFLHHRYLLGFPRHHDLSGFPSEASLNGLTTGARLPCVGCAPSPVSLAPNVHYSSRRCPY
jgi:hypothetical protein